MSLDRESLSHGERSRLIRESVGLVHDFAGSELGKSMSSTYVLIPTDNKQLADVNRDAAKTARRKGENALMISASRVNSGEPYTIFSTLQSVQPEKPV